MCTFEELQQSLPVVLISLLEDQQQTELREKVEQVSVHLEETLLWSQKQKVRRSEDGSPGSTSPSALKVWKVLVTPGPPVEEPGLVSILILLDLSDQDTLLLEIKLVHTRLI